jgi:hypothetical protein
MKNETIEETKQQNKLRPTLAELTIKQPTKKL